MGKIGECTYRKYDPQETENREHDETLAVKKVLFYGWDGLQAVTLNIIDGKIGVTLG